MIFYFQNSLLSEVAESPPLLCEKYKHSKNKKGHMVCQILYKISIKLQASINMGQTLLVLLHLLMSVSLPAEVENIVRVIHCKGFPLPISPVSILLCGWKPGSNARSVYVATKLSRPSCLTTKKPRKLLWSSWLLLTSHDTRMYRGTQTHNYNVSIMM